jgi:hypothetical protein
MLVSLSKLIVRVVLYLALWLLVWLPRLLLGWQPDSPLALSFETLGLH